MSMLVSMVMAKRELSTSLARKFVNVSCMQIRNQECKMGCISIFVNLNLLDIFREISRDIFQPGE